MRYRLFLLFALLLAGCGTKLSAPTANIVVGLDALGSFPLGAPIPLDGSTSTDPNGEPLAYRWRLAAAPRGSAATIAAPDATTTSFTPDAAGDYVVELVVSDGAFTSLPATTTLTAGPCGAGIPKISAISASPAAASAGQPVLLTAAVSDSDADADAGCAPPERLSYAWSLAALPANSRATLNDVTSEAPTLFTDEPGEYRVALVVTDRLGHVSEPVEKTVTVTGCPSEPPDVSAITASNANPNTGERVVFTPTLVQAAPPSAPATDAGVPATETGCASGAHFENHWTIVSAPAGSSAMLSNPSASEPWFVPDVPGDYVLELYVQNDRGDRSPAKTVTVRASVCGSRAPTLGDVTATSTAPAIGQAVGLSVVASDADTNGECGLTEHFTYAWTFTALPTGSVATLSNPSLEAPSFLVDQAGDYGVQVVVTDAEGHASGPKSLTITASGCGGNAPVVSSVKASPAAPNTGGTVTLSATATDADTVAPCTSTETLVLTWTLLSVPAGSQAALSGAHQTSPWFSPDVPGKYVVEAWATDSTGKTSAGKTLDVTAATCGSAAPSIGSITASPSPVTVGSGVSLAASVTDADSGGTCKLTESRSYAWTLTAAPSGSVATLTSTTSPVSGLSPDVAGTYTVALVVTDAAGHASAQATTNVVATDPVTSTCGRNAPAPRLASVTAGPCVSATCTVATTTPTPGSAPNATPPGYVVKLNGHGSVRLDASGTTDADNASPCNAKQTLTDAWTILVAPVGSKASWSIGTGPTTTLVAPTFVPDLPGLYQVGLVVSDGTLSSSMLVVQIEL